MAYVIKTDEKGYVWYRMEKDGQITATDAYVPLDMAKKIQTGGKAVKSNLEGYPICVEYPELNSRYYFPGEAVPARKKKD